jgi:hypothetical protein
VGEAGRGQLALAKSRPRNCALISAADSSPDNPPIDITQVVDLRPADRRMREGRISRVAKARRRGGRLPIVAAVGARAMPAGGATPRSGSARGPLDPDLDRSASSRATHADEADRIR